MIYHVISFYSMLYHVISCYIMLYHVISRYIMLYHVISCYIMLYHVILTNALEYQLTVHLVCFLTITQEFPPSNERLSRQRSENLIHLAMSCGHQARWCPSGDVGCASSLSLLYIYI